MARNEPKRAAISTCRWPPWRALIAPLFALPINCFLSTAAISVAFQITNTGGGQKGLNAIPNSIRESNYAERSRQLTQPNYCVPISLGVICAAVDCPLWTLARYSILLGTMQVDTRYYLRLSNLPVTVMKRPMVPADSSIGYCSASTVADQVYSVSPGLGKVKFAL